ncbi:MAG: hypothetical protein AB7E55_29565 [Pigmentiphaga sp.]
MAIDISIPWKVHQALRHGDLAKWLVYPEDMNLDVEIANNCFMKNSWDDLRMRLRELLIG